MPGTACQSSGHLHSDLPAFAFERIPGAATKPLPRSYRRREPENTALYKTVQEHLNTFLEDASSRHESGAGYPGFIEREFRRYLDCGLLAHGFARVRCPSCGHERLVAFSCKGRLCPACWARRTGDTAAREGSSVESARADGVREHVDQLIRHLGAARLTEICNQGREKLVLDDLVENLPEGWVAIGD